MTNTMQIAALFLAQLGLGSAVVFPLIPVRVAGKSFARFYYGLILAALALFLAALHRLDQYHSNYLIAVLPAAWIWLLSFTREMTRLEEYLYAVFAVFAFCLFAVYTQKYVLNASETALTLFRLALLFAAALFLSFHLMSMIFGHWYLVNRALPIVHLIKTCRWLLAFSYARAAATAAGTYYAWRDLEPERFARLVEFTGHGLFFWPRILAGIGLPLLVAHLAHASAKIGSNQSATGILYAGVVFVILGEVLALYLFAITGYLF